MRALREKAGTVKKILAVVAGVGCFLAFEPSSWAFCRATTCDPSDPKQSCQRDPTTKCVVTGEPLYWASSCLTISVQADAAAAAGIDYAAAKASVERAFEAWTNVDCGGGAKPSLKVNVTGPVECKKSEYSGEHRNANIVWFRDDTWPHGGAEDALGLTQVTFAREDAPGELWDTDIEINAVSEPLSVGNPKADEVDLDSLLTHEAGHVLGLAHTLDVASTMIQGYETGTKELSTLSPDDIEGICTIYPPGRKASTASCEPRHGFSELCAADQPPEEPVPDDPTEAGGCAISSATPSSTAWLPLFLLFGFGRAWRSRSRFR